jgi:hypothetical protein
MNINQLLILTLFLSIYVIINRSTYENFTGEVTQASCVERILNYECTDEDKKKKLNEDCSIFELYIDSGVVNISCDNKMLYDWLFCNKMLTEGACECSYGRRQVSGMCSEVDITCPSELQSKDLAIIEKIQELQTESQKCVNVQRKEKELFGIASTLKTMMKDRGILKEEGSTSYLWIIFVIMVLIGSVIFYINKK